MTHTGRVKDIHVTQRRLNETDLILLVDRRGGFEWSAHRSDAEVANMLRGIADKIEGRTAQTVKTCPCGHLPEQHAEIRPNDGEFLPYSACFGPACKCKFSPEEARDGAVDTLVTSPERPATR